MAKKLGRPTRNDSELIPNPPNALRALRVQKDVSAAAVANATGLHKEAIIRLEVKGFGVGPEGRERLAKYYGVKVWDLNNLDLAQEISENIQKNLPSSVTNC